MQQRASNVDCYCRRGTFFRTATGDAGKQPAYAPAPSFALPNAANEARRSGVQYANTSYPYLKMVRKCDIRRIRAWLFSFPSEQIPRRPRHVAFIRLLDHLSRHLPLV